MNLTPLLERLSIRHTDLTIAKFQLNWAQQEYMEAAHAQLNAGRPVRLITLKARQIGISTLTEAIGFLKCFIEEGTQGLVVAHETEPSEHLLAMTRLYWETYPFKNLYTTTYRSKKELAWEMGSSMRVTTAHNAKAGRARTIHFLHASEVAFWQDPVSTMLGLRQAIPNLPQTMIVLESTANGIGNFFHDQWLAAEQGESEFTPLFFPWHRHPAYMASAIGLEYHELTRIDSEERALRAMGVSDDRLTWRRWAIRNLANNDINNFRQEYPAFPEEAFIATGTNVFPLPKLRDIYQPSNGMRGRLMRDGSSNRIKFVNDSEGPLKIFKKPSEDTDWGQYLIGGDPTHTVKGDFACAQVINRRTLEQVAVWRAKIDPGSFAEVLAQLGWYYNGAMLVPEIEGPGLMTIGKLIGLEYPFVYRHTRPDRVRGKMTDIYGWSTTTKSKHMAISWLLKVIVDRDLLIHDSETFKELQNYVTMNNGAYGPGNDRGHDDTVMAMAIAVASHLSDSPVSSYTGEQTYEEKPTTAEIFDELQGNNNSPSWMDWSEDAN